MPEPVLLRQRDSSFYDHPATGVKQQERDVVDDLWNDAFGDEDPLLNIWQALGMFWMKFPVFHERAQGEIHGLFTPGVDCTDAAALQERRLRRNSDPSVYCRESVVQKVQRDFHDRDNSPLASF